MFKESFIPTSIYEKKTLFMMLGSCQILFEEWKKFKIRAVNFFLVKNILYIQHGLCFVGFLSKDLWKKLF